MAITRYPTVSGSTYWTTLTANASANTKGAYVQLTASTPEALRGVFVIIPIGSAASAGFVADIAVGAASAEVVVVADVMFSSPAANTANNQLGVFIPVAIAAGVRLSARCACSVGGATVGFALLAVGGTSTAVATTYGTSGASGTSVDPGGSVNTKGSYSQFTAATTADLDWLIVILAYGNAGPTSGSWAIDIATGAALSEVVVVPDLGWRWGTAYGPVTFQVPVSIAAGTRLSARMQSTVTDTVDRVMAMEVIGITNSGMTGGSSTGGAIIGGGLGARGLGVF